MVGAAQQALGLIRTGRGLSGVLSRPSRQPVAGQHPATGLCLEESYSMLSGKNDPCCCLVGEIVGLFRSFLFSAPGSRRGRAGLAT